MSGVITAIRSSPPMSLFNASISGCLILMEPSGATNLGSRNSTTTRARGSAIARRISAIVDGSRRVVCVVRTRDGDVLELHNLLRHAVLENFDLVLLKIGHRLVARRRVHVDADVVDLGRERAWCRRILRGEQRKTKNEKRIESRYHADQQRRTRDTCVSIRFSFSFFVLLTAPEQQSTLDQVLDAVHGIIKP